MTSLPKEENNNNKHTIDKGLLEEIKRSGHALTFRIYKKLAELGLSPELSPRYVDDVTGKIREIDIIAKKEDQFVYDGKTYFFIVEFIIETKHLVKPMVLFTQENDLPEGEKIGDRFAHMTVPEDDKIVEIGLFGIIENHRYYDYKTSVFSVNSKTNSENDPFFISTFSTVKSIVFRKNKIIDSSLNNIFKLFFPIIVTSGESFYQLTGDVDIDSDKDIEEKLDKSHNYALAKVNYQEKMDSFRDKEIWNSHIYYIDIVKEEDFEKLVRIILRDVARIKMSLNKKDNITLK
jgi:hypothetical protein